MFQSRSVNNKHEYDMDYSGLRGIGVHLFCIALQFEKNWGWYWWRHELGRFGNAKIFISWHTLVYFRTNIKMQLLKLITNQIYILVLGKKHVTNSKKSRVPLKLNLGYQTRSHVCKYGPAFINFELIYSVCMFACLNHRRQSRSRLWFQFQQLIFSFIRVFFSSW